MMESMSTSILWFRRDLRRADNPALVRAVESADALVPLFVIDPALWGRAGPPRQAYLLASLDALAESIGGLTVRCGDPVAVVPAVAAEADAREVFVSGRLRTVRCASRRCRRGGLDEPARELRRLVRAGSPYASIRARCVASRSRDTRSSRRSAGPGASTAGAGPVATPRSITWRLDLPGEALPPAELPAGLSAARSRVRPPRVNAGTRSSSKVWLATRRLGTGPTSTRPRGCPCTSSGARSTRGPCSRISAR